MYGEALDREQVERIFGEERKGFINDFLTLGILITTDDEKIRMNSLSLASKRLRNGECVYVFVDTPERFGTSLYPRRAYIGADSFILLRRIEQIADISGVAVDMGSGSGIQLIALLKLFPEIKKGIGVEIDERAVNICRFNAWMNGVGERFRAVRDKRALRRELAGELISFVTMNPPFMPIPEMVSIRPEDKKLLEGIVPVVEIEDKFYLNLKELYPISGWGGTDGIAVTGQFLDIVLPLLEDGAEILIYSCFAGDRDGPAKIAEYLRSKDGLSFHFEPAPLNLITALAWAADIANRICYALAKPERQYKRFSSFKRALSYKIYRSFKQSDITHIHEGHLVIRFKSPPTAEARSSSAGKAPTLSAEGQNLALRKIASAA